MDENVILALALKNSGGGGTGTSNYNQLSNKPQVNGVTLSGNKSSSDLNLLGTDDSLTNEQLSNLLDLL